MAELDLHDNYGAVKVVGTSTKSVINVRVVQSDKKVGVNA